MVNLNHSIWTGYDFKGSQFVSIIFENNGLIIFFLYARDVVVLNLLDSGFFFHIFRFHTEIFLPPRKLEFFARFVLLF